ncbi:MAG: hypothetical protein M0R74_03730 [Dehalococcoidia bacterium]|nr:hypothetical protein [Dehalococcoidia bacterium]
MTTRRAGKSKFRGTKLLTAGAGLAVFALVLGAVGARGYTGGGSEGDGALLVVERRPVIIVSGSGAPTVNSQLQQVPSSPPQRVDRVRSARTSRGS